MAGTLTISGLAAGLPTGEKVIGPVTMTGTNVIGQIMDLALTAGDNTLAVPAGASAVLIVLAVSNVGTLKLRSNLNASDAGTPFGPGGYLVWPVTAGTTSLIINSSAVTTAEATFI